MEDRGRSAFSPTDAERLHRTLAELSEAVGRLQEQLAELATEAAMAEQPAASAARRARAEVHNRAVRARFFDQRLFCDPAWDMLLELFQQQSAERPIRVRSLCAASGVPATTALRWIRVLEEAGLAERVRDPSDRRQIFVHLTADGHARIASYLAALRPHEAPAPDEPGDAPGS
jgi:DNA-binding MarR family transcriptional regulator